jgi:dynein light chain LC8-type
MNDFIETVKYNLDGKEVQPKTVKHDIIEDLKKRAYDLAIESMSKYSVERDMADFIKLKFDEEFISEWHCVVGKDYAVSLTHESEHFIFFSIESTYFLLFKL